MTTPATRTSDVRHSPEPWIDGRTIISSGCTIWVCIGNKDCAWSVGTLTCVMPNRPGDDEVRKARLAADAARACACVNAMASIPDPQKYVEAAKEMREFVSKKPCEATDRLGHPPYADGWDCLAAGHGVNCPRCAAIAAFTAVDEVRAERGMARHAVETIVRLADRVDELERALEAVKRYSAVAPNPCYCTRGDFDAPDKDHSCTCNQARTALTPAGGRA